MEPQEELELEWPPRAEDLRRMYLEEKLSAAKIAARYGLKFASPKTAESTILYHLKRNGISRRDKAEHNRKVTEEMVDGWVKRYEAGDSLKDIADGPADWKVNHVTVFNHLRKRGLKLRDKVEAQIQAVTIHKKKSFEGDPNLRSYLIGISKGDYWATSHGRATRVKLSTTHPAMARLFRELFGSYGPVYEYPRLCDLTEFEWSLDCDLDKSFDFLKDVSQPANEVTSSIQSRFLNLLAGFFDAEGAIWYHEGGSFEVSMSNIDHEFIRRINLGLVALGFSPTTYVKKQRENPRISGKISEFISVLHIWKHSEVPRFLEMVPIRHPEKKKKAAIALKWFQSPDPVVRRATLMQWEECKLRIEQDVADYVQRAKAQLVTNSEPGL